MTRRVGTVLIVLLLAIAAGCDGGDGEVATQPPPGTTSTTTGEAALKDAVRQALRDYTRPDLLAEGRLLSSSLLADAERSPEGVRALLREIVEGLSGNPKDARLYRALWHTYIEPAPTQEQVAERSGFNQQYLSGLERGRRNPTVVTLHELAQALGVSHTELVQPPAARFCAPADDRRGSSRSGRRGRQPGR